MKINQELADKFPWGANKGWEHRTKRIADFLPDNCSAVDVGGGFCHLTKLVNFREYVSIDIKDWTDKTVLADFNKGEFPEVGAFEFVICQGIIEYMVDPLAFLKGISKYGSRLILTYRKGKQKVGRYRNDLSFQKVEELLNKAGYRIVVRQWVCETEGVYNEKLFYCVNTKYGKKR
jgi:hypothetical protein